MSVDTVMLACMDRSISKRAIAVLEAWKADRLERLPVVGELTVYENRKRRIALARVWYREIDVDANEQLRRDLESLGDADEARVSVITFYGDDIDLQLNAMLEQYDGLDDPFIDEHLEPTGPGWKMIERFEQ